MYPRPPNTWTTRSAQRHAASEANSFASDALAWTTLGSAPESASHGALAGEQPRRGRVGRRIGQREADALEVVDALPELHALRRPLDREAEQPLHRPRASRADVDPLLDEPVVRQLIGPAHAAEHGRRRARGRPQHELRMAIGERVRVIRVVLEGDARRVVVDEEQRRQAPLALDTRQWKIMKSVSSRSGDEPLLAVEDVLAGRRVADGRRARGPARRSPAPSSVIA